MLYNLLRPLSRAPVEACLACAGCVLFTNIKTALFTSHRTRLREGSAACRGHRPHFKRVRCDVNQKVLMEVNNTHSAHARHASTDPGHLRAYSIEDPHRKTQEGWSQAFWRSRNRWSRCHKSPRATSGAPSHCAARPGLSLS